MRTATMLVLLVAIVGCGGTEKTGVATTGGVEVNGNEGTSDLVTSSGQDLLIRGSFSLEGKSKIPPPVLVRIMRGTGENRVVVGNKPAKPKYERGAARFEARLEAPSEIDDYELEVIDGLRPEHVITARRLRVEK